MLAHGGCYRARPRIGDRPLETVPDLDAEVRAGGLRLIRHVEDDKPAIAERIAGGSSRSNPPGAPDVERGLLDGSPAERRERHPDDVGARLGLERPRAIL